MPPPQVHLIAFLSNVDNSIVALDLGNQFRIRQLSEAVGVALITKLEDIGAEMAYERADVQFACLNHREKKFYAVQKTYPLLEDQIAKVEQGEMPDMTEMLVDNY